MTRCIFSLTFFLVLHIALYGQSVTYKRYTSTEGISNSLVYRICEDKNGYIWTTTDYGINKFDGYNFTHYFPDSSGSVLAIGCDPANKIWVSGLQNNLYVIEHDSITRFHPKRGSIPLNIRHIIADSDGRTWLITNNDKIGYKAGYIDNGSYFEFEPDIRDEKLEVYRLLPVAKDSVVFATNHGAFVLTKNNFWLLDKRLSKPVYAIAKSDSSVLYFGGWRKWRIRMAGFRSKFSNEFLRIK